MEGILGNLDDADANVDRDEIRSKLSNMSFEDLQKLKAELGTKLYKEARYGSSKLKQTNFKRANKNRPREASSKVKPKPEMVERGKKKNIRDPRFDALSGSFNRAAFEKDYEFVDEIRKNEKERLKELLKNEKNEYHANKLKYLIQRMDNQDREKSRRVREQEKRLEERREQIQALKSGRKPLYKTKFEKKVGNIVEKYEELKTSGKLMKYMEKKQKKMNSKAKHIRYFDTEALNATT